MTFPWKNKQSASVRSAAAKPRRGLILARIMFTLSLAATLALGFLWFGAGVADAASSFADDSYVNELMSGKANSAGGWNENVIVETDPANLKNASADTITQQVSDFLLNMGLAIIGFSVIFAVFRLAGRGIYEMAFSNMNGKEGDVSCPAFFLTSKERKKGINKDWVKPMIVETGIFLGIGLFVGTIISVTAGIALTLLDFGNANIIDGSQINGSTSDVTPSTPSLDWNSGSGTHTGAGAARSIRNL